MNAGVSLLNSVTQTVSGVAGGSESAGLLGGVGGEVNNNDNKQVSKYLCTVVFKK